MHDVDQIFYVHMFFLFSMTSYSWKYSLICWGILCELRSKLCACVVPDAKIESISDKKIFIVASSHMSRPFLFPWCGSHWYTRHRYDVVSFIYRIVLFLRSHITILIKKTRVITGDDLLCLNPILNWICELLKRRYQNICQTFFIPLG